MNLIFEAVYGITDAFLLLNFLLNFCNNSWEENKKAILLILGLTALSFIFIYFKHFFILEPITYIIYLYISTRLFKNKTTKLKSIFSSVISVFIILFATGATFMIAQCCSNIDLSSFTDSISPLRFGLIVISKILIFLVMSIVLMLIKKKDNKISIIQSLILIIFPILSIKLISILIELNSKSNFDDETQRKIVLLIIGIFMFNILVYIFYAYVNKYTKDIIDYKTQLQRIKFDNDKLKEGYEIYDSIRLLKHDISNQLTCLQEYVKNENPKDDLQTYIDKMNRRIDKTYNYINASNKMLNYIVNTRYNLAKSKDIEFNIFINDNITYKNIDDMDLSSILSNVLDNAIRASEKEKSKLITLNIEQQKGYVVFTVKNKISTSVLKNNKDLETTKANKSEHGFGIKQIKRIAEKYNGYVSIDDKNNFFTIKVFLNI